MGLKVCTLAHFLHTLWTFEIYLKFLKLFIGLAQIPSKALSANDRELPNHTDRRQLDLLFVRCHCQLTTGNFRTTPTVVNLTCCSFVVIALRSYRTCALQLWSVPTSDATSIRVHYSFPSSSYLSHFAMHVSSPSISLFPPESTQQLSFCASTTRSPPAKGSEGRCFIHARTIGSSSP